MSLEPPDSKPQTPHHSAPKLLHYIRSLTIVVERHRDCHTSTRAKTSFVELLNVNTGPPSPIVAILEALDFSLCLFQVQSSKYTHLQYLLKSENINTFHTPKHCLVSLIKALYTYAQPDNAYPALFADTEEFGLQFCRREHKIQNMCSAKNLHKEPTWSWLFERFSLPHLQFLSPLLQSSIYRPQTCTMHDAK